MAKRTAIEVRKKEGENINTLIYRFNKRIKQSGILKEAKKRRFRLRNVNRIKKRQSALYRVKKERELKRLKKTGGLVNIN